jgi:acyl-CoA synthetase (AMP-forming)/AMP-acid ligase II
MNLAMILDISADGLGDRAAIGSRHGGLTYAELRQAARAGAHALRDGSHATLAMAEPTGPVVPVALFAAAWAGASYAPLNYRLPASTLTGAVTHLPSPLLIGDENLGGTSADEWLAKLPSSVDASASAYPEDPEHPAVLLLTSGTSAAPKTAVLDHDNLLSYIFNTGEFGSAGEDEAILLAVPPFHIAGVAAVLSATWSGRRIVPLPVFSADAWIATARTEAVTHAFVVPTMLARIVAALDAGGAGPAPALRSLAYGGARMPAPVLERALRLFPDTDFANAYGLTETSSTIAVLGPEDHRAAMTSDDPAVRRRLGSVGQPVPGVEVRVVDSEIQVRGDQVAGGYLDRDGRIDADGWLATGDRGSLDDEGYVYVEGRLDDMIIRGGENISPAEIEDTLLRYEGVATAAVIGLPDEEWGEKIAAAVVAAPGYDIDAEQLCRFVREQLGSIKTPSVVEVRLELPTTATGKILRRQLRDELGLA